MILNHIFPKGSKQRKAYEESGGTYESHGRDKDSTENREVQDRKKRNKMTGKQTFIISKDNSGRESITHKIGPKKFKDSRLFLGTRIQKKLRNCELQ